MGTTANMFAQCFKMGKLNKQDKALKAVKASFSKTGIERPYELHKILSAITFDEVAEYLGWGLILKNPTDLDSKISGIDFINEKLHVTVANQFFNAIAEFVPIGCFVYIKDDFGVHYNWDFGDDGVEFSEN